MNTAQDKINSWFCNLVLLLNIIMSFHWKKGHLCSGSKFWATWGCNFMVFYQLTAFIAETHLNLCITDGLLISRGTVLNRVSSTHILFRFERTWKNNQEDVRNSKLRHAWAIFSEASVILNTVGEGIKLFGCVVVRSQDQKDQDLVISGSSVKLQMQILDHRTCYTKPLCRSVFNTENSNLIRLASFSSTYPAKKAMNSSANHWDN